MRRNFAQDNAGSTDARNAPKYVKDLVQVIEIMTVSARIYRVPKSRDSADGSGLGTSGSLAARLGA